MNTRLLILFLTIWTYSVEAEGEELIFNIIDVCKAQEIKAMSIEEIEAVSRCVEAICNKNSQQCFDLSEDLHGRWYEVHVEKFLNQENKSILRKLHDLSEWVRLENIELLKSGKKLYEFKEIEHHFINRHKKWDGHLVKSMLANGFYDEKSLYYFYQNIEPGVYFVKEYLARNNSQRLLEDLLKINKLDSSLEYYPVESVAKIVIKNIESDLLNTKYLNMIKTGIANNDELKYFFKEKLIDVLKSRKEFVINSIIDEVFIPNKKMSLWPIIATVSNHEIANSLLKSISSQDEYNALLEYLKLITQFKDKKLSLTLDLLKSNSEIYKLVLVDFSSFISSYGQIQENENFAEFVFLNHLYKNRENIEKEIIRKSLAKIKTQNSSSDYYLLELGKLAYERKRYVQFVQELLIKTASNSILFDFIPTATLIELEDIFEITERHNIDFWSVVNSLWFNSNVQEFLEKKLKSNKLGQYVETLIYSSNSLVLNLIGEFGQRDLIVNFIDLYLREQGRFNYAKADLEKFMKTLEKRSDIRIPRRLSIKLKKSLVVENTNVLNLLREIAKSSGSFESIENLDQINRALEIVTKIVSLSELEKSVDYLAEALERLENTIYEKESDILESWVSQLYKLIEVQKISIKNGLVIRASDHTLLGKLLAIYKKEPLSLSKENLLKSMEFVNIPENVREPLTYNLNSAVYLLAQFKYSLASTNKEDIKSFSRKELDSLKNAITFYGHLPSLIAQQSNTPSIDSSDSVLRDYFSSMSVHFNTFKDYPITGFVNCSDGSECILKFQKRKNIGPTTMVRSFPQKINQTISYGPYLAVNELGKNVSTSKVINYKSRSLEVSGFLNDILVIDTAYLKSERPGKPLDGRPGAPPEYGTRNVVVEVCTTRIKFGFGSWCVNREPRTVTETFLKVPARKAHPGRDALAGISSGLVSIKLSNPIKTAPFASIIILNSPSDASEPGKGGKGCQGCQGDFTIAGKDGESAFAGNIGEVRLNNFAKDFPVLILNKRTPDPINDSDLNEEEN